MAKFFLIELQLPLALAVMLTPISIYAEQESDLTELSFEELVNVEITSVSRRAQPISEAAAAVFVITNEDLRRSGATTIPEALRMAPGIQVAQLDSNKWSVTARGFSGRFANKLLVLIDGRTVYTPGFSGVYWEQLDVMMKDVERIEVIRGPGATLWGANAVNGVINIITKASTDTRNGYASVGMGTEERVTGELRYGSELSSETQGRAYIKYAEKDELITDSGADGADAWDIGQGGFRLDSERLSGDRFSLQGDLYRGEYDQHLKVPALTPPTYTDTYYDTAEGTGWNLLGRWERPLSLSSELALQVYYDHFQRQERAVFSQEYDTFDIDFQHSSNPTNGHNLIWGLGYRAIQAEIDPTDIVTSNVDTLTTELWSGFIQDEIELIENRLRLTLGSKFEQNDFTGFEYQPNLRLLWQLEEQKVLWAAISRAVRTPSIGEYYLGMDTLVIPPSPPYSPLPILVVSQGHSNFESEKLIAYELGFRAQPESTLSLDAALFWNEYDNLRTVESSEPYLSEDHTYLILEAPFDNKAHGSIYGLELSADWLWQEGWRLAIAYSFAKANLESDTGSVDTTNIAFGDNLPGHQLSLRSMKNINADVDLDVWVRYVDESTVLSSLSLGQVKTIDAYWDLDVRLAWRPAKGIELSLVGQNLLQDSRLEGTTEVLTVDHNEVQRGVYGTLKIEF